MKKTTKFGGYLTIYINVIILLIFPVITNRAFAVELKPQKSIFDKMINVGPLVKLPRPITVIETPIKLNNIPPMWQKSQFKYRSSIAFVENKQSINVVGHAVKDWQSINLPGKGDFSGTVRATISEMNGEMSNSYIAMTSAYLKAGDVCMELGFSFFFHNWDGGPNLFQLEHDPGDVYNCSSNQ